MQGLMKLFVGPTEKAKSQVKLSHLIHSADPIIFFSKLTLSNSMVSSSDVISDVIIKLLSLKQRY